MSKQIPGQISLFNFIDDPTDHSTKGDPDYKGSLDEITRLSIELDFENTITLNPCCEVTPEKMFKSCHDYFVKCPVCGSRTKYHPKMYKAMQAWNRGEVDKKASKGAVHRYLRYGPHTLIPEVREETRKYLEEYGVPDWVKWDKSSLPCENCTWFDGKTCRSGGHTCHYEFDYLICDGFYQSIVERKPSTVGDAFPSIKTKEPTDDYIKENPTCFYVLGHYLDKAAGWHKVPEELPNFATWQTIDVVLFGKQTSTAWMEHEKWEAKDWTFRSLDERRNTETTEVLAWKLSDPAGQID